MTENTPDSITVYTWNGDFNRPGDKVDIRTLIEHGAQGILGQELWSPGHNLVNLRNSLPHFHVNQATTGGPDAMTGIAIDPAFKVGKEFHRLGIKSRPGVKMATRDIAVSDVMVNGKYIRFINVHFPKKAYRFLWPIYAARVAAIKASSPYPVVIGGDWNAEVNGALVGQFAKRLGLKRYGHSIDGFLYAPQLRFRAAPTVGNAATRSDHPSPGGTFSWKA